MTSWLGRAVGDTRCGKCCVTIFKCSAESFIRYVYTTHVWWMYWVAFVEYVFLAREYAENAHVLLYDCVYVQFWLYYVCFGNIYKWCIVYALRDCSKIHFFGLLKSRNTLLLRKGICHEAHSFYCSQNPINLITITTLKGLFMKLENGF